MSLQWADLCACEHIRYFHDGTWNLKPDEGVCQSCKMNGKVCDQFRDAISS